MKKSKMNPRLREILKKLCAVAGYVTIAEIAGGLGVSAKTVARELPEAEKLLSLHGGALDKKAGAGIRLQGGGELRLRIMEIIEQAEPEAVFSPQERQAVVISRLLQKQTPVKLYEFTSILKVTEGTISNDLDKLEGWFTSKNLTLVRKPGLGVYIEGEERNIRKAIVHYIYEHMNEEELLTVLDARLSDGEREAAQAVAGSSRSLLELVDVRLLRQLENVVRSAETGLDQKLADGAYVGLIVHLALAIQRIRQNEKIAMEQGFLDKLQERREFSIAKKLAEHLSEVFAVSVPQGEIGYIAMHLLGARSQYGVSSAGLVFSNFQLVKLARAMMKIAQEETGQPLLHNEKLLAGLVNHLGPSLSRLHMNLEIRNPLLEEMRRAYPQLLALGEKCAAAVEKELGRKMPEAETAYIGMHIGAAMQEFAPQRRARYNVAVACPTGMGTSRLLAAKLRREYESVKVVDMISAIRVSADDLQRRGIDFIISTVPIHGAPLPVVVVGPLLKESDRGKIDGQIRRLNQQAAYRRIEPRRSLEFRERLRLLTAYGQAVAEILDNFFVIESCPAAHMRELAAAIGTAAGAAAEKSREIAESIMEREAFGKTRIADGSIALLHCRTEAVSALRLGVAHLNGLEEEARLKTALVMLAPQACSQPAIETIGHISEILLHRWGFLEVLQRGGKERLVRELEHIFTVFYQEKNKILMEE